MNLRKFLALGALAFFSPCAAASAASVVKTWVSSAGSDTGSCDISAPCASLQYAFSQTAAGGEIEVRDSGNYGPLSINHSVSVISSSAGATLSDYGFATSGIYVGAGSSDVVTIRGFTINGHNASQTIGIAIASAKSVTIDHCIISGATNAGIAINSSNTYLMITNNLITQNGYGIYNISSAYIAIGGNVIAGNTIGLYNGTFHTYGDNDINTNSSSDESGVTSQAVSRF